MVKWEERGLINSKRKELVHGELVKQVPDNLLLPTEIARVHKKGTRKKKKKKKNPVTAQGTKDTKKCICGNIYSGHTSMQELCSMSEGK